MRIALIDSGVDKSRLDLSRIEIINSYRSNKVTNDIDSIGHGTAISYIFSKQLYKSTIYSVKIFDENIETSEEDLLQALNFINETLDVDIIHISNGINTLNNLPLLEKICNELYHKGISIISAADNQGIVSYPAALRNVIGVYWDSYRKNVSDYIFVENSPTNILGYVGNQLLPWSHNQNKVVSGSSFTAPYITCLVAELILKGVTNYNIWKHLKHRASNTISYNDKTYSISETHKMHVSKITKAIVFPVSKETHSLLGNIDLLDFSIEAVYDFPMSRNIGKDIKDIIYGYCKAEKKIESIQSLDWNGEFDTIILGHTNLINEMFDRDYLEYFLEHAKKFKKNIFVFDQVPKNILNEKYMFNEHFIVSPYPEKDDVTIDTFGSLYKFNNPVIGIVGTTPQQGKFNLQLSMRRSLLEMGYSVGQIGTEPTSYLFGMDIALPNGYDSQIELSPQEQIFFINKLISKLHEKDIIIVGTQSQTVPYSFGNLGFYPIEQTAVLLAAEPDATILCINLSDDISYIRRTMNYLENYFDTIVIAFSLYPREKINEWNVNINNSNNEKKEILDEYKLIIERSFNIPVYINGVENEDLAVFCVDYFSEK